MPFLFREKNGLLKRASQIPKRGFNSSTRGCAIAVLILWRRGELGRLRARESRWLAAAALAAVYCVWASIGIGGKSLGWALALCAVGIPVYWWYAVVRRPALAT